MRRPPGCSHEAQAEREEPVIAERVPNRPAEQDRVAAVAPPRVAGRAVLLIPHRGENPEEAALPGDYRKILALVREANGPVQVRAVCERLRLDTSVRVMQEPLRTKMTKFADRGWLHKRPDGHFAARR
ncbi:hypothetical protein [Streptomyces pseudovenezuelae]|uniref:Uncharacterized protein n=1 Tax=Streptomyces pseudovenezuelae TaxID=67350 RepID=A0ABZ1XB35_9ACTN|nr:hypothetical protein [Streptomyces pseudovenezuelae]